MLQKIDDPEFDSDCICSSVLEKIKEEDNGLKSNRVTFYKLLLAVNYMKNKCEKFFEILKETRQF